MVRPNAIKLTLSIPTHDNSGAPFLDEDYVWLLDQLVTLFPEGHTRVGNVSGYWQGHNDENMLYFATIGVENEIQAEAALAPVRSFLTQAKERFRQDAMYLEWEWVNVELL